VVSLVDVVPTLLRRLLVDAPPDLPGRDLLADGAETQDSVPLLDTLAYGAMRRTGLIERGYKLILAFADGTWRARLYRRGQEGTDLAAPAPQIASSLRDSLAALQARNERGARAEAAQDVSDEERAALQALGYATDGTP
jgi:hypothetical protein